MRWRRIRRRLYHGKAFWACIFSFISFQSGVDSEARRRRQRKRARLFLTRAEHKVVVEPAGGLAAVGLAGIGRSSEPRHRPGADHGIDADGGLNSDAETRLDQAQLVLCVGRLLRIEGASNLALAIRPTHPGGGDDDAKAMRELLI